MVLGMCDISTSNFNLTGEVVAMNPYGHLPGRMYGLLPFTRYLLFGYLILCLFWLLKCVNFHSQLMSVHYLIFMVLVIFLIDTLLRLHNYTIYNKLGQHDQTWTLVAIVISALARTVGRAVVLLVVMG